MKNFKKIILSSILLFLVTIYGCSFLEKKPDNGEIIISSNYYNVNLEEKIELPLEINNEAIHYESDKKIVSINKNVIFALEKGSATIYGYNENKKLICEYVININDNFSHIKIAGTNFIELGKSSQYSATIFPSSLNQEIIWESSDEEIITINSSGLATTINEGIARIYATSKYHPDYRAEITVLVAKKPLNTSGVSNHFENKNITIDASNLESIFYPLIESASSYIIGVNKYTKSFFKESLSSIGTGVIYKREPIYKDDGSTIKSYKYYVLTNRHVVINNSRLTVYCNEIDLEIDANLVQYDDKVDIALLTFESGVYFSCAKFANSDDVKQGEFCIALGHPFGYELNDSATFGIISHTTRYLADDTDGDGTNDWDARYIQHDAAINEGNSGGPLINLKGEVIGINTLKISTVEIEDMGFAIPINTILELLSSLEKGIKIERPLLNVQALEVKTIITSESLLDTYPVPSEITHGIYVVEVEKDGVAYKAGILKNDIIVALNGAQIYYTYILRAELNKFVIGSGQKCSIVVYRNNAYVELEAIF